MLKAGFLVEVIEELVKRIIKELIMAYQGQRQWRRGMMQRPGMYRRGGRRVTYGRPSRRMDISRSANYKASVALRMIKKLRNEEEKKMIYVNGGLALVAATPQYIGLNLIQQGNTGSTRIGNRISMQSLTLRVHTKLADNEAKGADYRIMIIMDRRPEGAQAVMTDSHTLNACRALINTDEDMIGRFSILFDKNVHLNVEGTAGRTYKAFIELRGQQATYNGNVGDVTDLQKNYLYMIAFCQDNDQNAVLQYAARMRYTDA